MGAFEPAASRAVLVLDFEGRALGDEWSAAGDVQAARRAGPAFAAGDEAHTDVPAGQALFVSSGRGRGGLATRAGVVPTEIGDHESLTLWIHRAPEEAQRRTSTTLELQFVEAPGVRLWRKLVVDHSGWQRFELPLRHFGWDATRVPHLGRIASFAVVLRDPGELAIDEIRLHDVDGGPGAFLATDEVRALAFGPPTEASGDGAPVEGDGVRVLARNGFELLTDVAALDADELFARLEAAAAELAPLVPPDEETRRVPRLVVFARDAAYREFAPRLGDCFARVAGPPRSDGYTLLGIAHAAWSESFATARPVFVHEFVHALLECRALLPNQSEWLQEGLATHVQVLLHPQADLGAIVTRALADPAAQRSLADLTDGRPIEVRHYWQAMTLVQTLARSERYRARFPELVAALRAAGSTELAPHLGTVLGTTFEELEREWRAHCAAHWSE